MQARTLRVLVNQYYSFWYHGGARGTVNQCHDIDLVLSWYFGPTLRWRNNEHDGVSNHQPHDCLLNRLSRRRSKKTPMLRVTGLCEGNSPVTGEFPAQRASDAENVSIWWRHHGKIIYKYPSLYSGIIPEIVDIQDLFSHSFQPSCQLKKWRWLIINQITQIKMLLRLRYFLSTTMILSSQWSPHPCTKMK